MEATGEAKRNLYCRVCIGNYTAERVVVNSFMKSTISIKCQRQRAGWKHMPHDEKHRKVHLCWI